MNYLLANNSGCSGGGCESGWTLYLDNSFVSPSYYNNNNGFSEEKRMILKNGDLEEEEEEEEDLSMVSDASSGPPQYFAEEEESNCCFYNYNAPLVDATAFCKNSGKNIKKVKENRHRKEVVQPSSLLDDTASSPVFDISNNNFTTGNNHEESGEDNVLDFSQGYSTTHFEESSAYQHQHQYGFFQSSLSGNYLQKNQWFQGRM